MPTNVAVHTISFRGKAGAIFVLLCCAVVLFVVGFVTEAWSTKITNNKTEREGLWETCTCSRTNRTDGTGISLSACTLSTLRPVPATSDPAIPFFYDLMV